MQSRHQNRRIYFEEQGDTTQKYVVPFIASVRPVTEDMEVLEIGCGEGGNMRPFMDLGCHVTGIDMAAGKIENAKEFFKDHPNFSRLNLMAMNIYDVTTELKQFDIIIMRDVLEHIHDHDRFMAYVKRFLKKDALFFIGIPPWQNPFGGHQQVLKSKILSRLPFIHLMPRFLYVLTLKAFGESARNIENQLEIRDTRLTIEKFNRLVKKEKYSVKKELFYFINPNYEAKFKLKPRVQSRIISGIPYLRNFFITTCYYLIVRSE
jgi:2-polyprenyl-3-methyl-5-hydroxy-6-metoxy-1,4-benzoquinol methylase